MNGRIMSYANEIISFQVYLEAARAYPECEEFTEDLDRARRAMEVAWLERGVGGALTADGNAEPPLPRPAFDPEIGWTTGDGW